MLRLVGRLRKRISVKVYAETDSTSVSACGVSGDGGGNLQSGAWIVSGRHARSVNLTHTLIQQVHFGARCPADGVDGQAMLVAWDPLEVRV